MCAYSLAVAVGAFSLAVAALAFAHALAHAGRRRTLHATAFSPHAIMLGLHATPAPHCFCPLILAWRIVLRFGVCLGSEQRVADIPYLQHRHLAGVHSASSLVRSLPAL